LVGEVFNASAGGVQTYSEGRLQMLLYEHQNTINQIRHFTRYGQSPPRP